MVKVDIKVKDDKHLGMEGVVCVIIVVFRVIIHKNYIVYDYQLLN
jgi:hypothetical protein